MEAKSVPGILAVTALTALLATACSSALPWSDQPVRDEVNIAFVIDRNLLYVPSVTIDNRAGRFFFSTAAPRTVLDPRFAPQSPGSHSVALNERETLHTSAVSLDLGPAGDAMIGADIWHNRAVTVDYHAGLLTFQKAGIFPALMTLYQFQGEPKINVLVNGEEMSAVVDTANPDTLELPGEAKGRGRAHVSIAGTDFGQIDVAYSPALGQPRVGNRLLSRFLVSIDYSRGIVGLWRDPRNG